MGKMRVVGGLVVVGGPTVSHIMPFVKMVRREFDEFESIDTLLTSDLNAWRLRQVCVELAVNDELVDPRRSLTRRIAAFYAILGMYRHFSGLTLLVPVTYRSFYIGGQEPQQLKERLVKGVYYNVSLGLECRRSIDLLYNVAFVHNFIEHRSYKISTPSNSYVPEDEAFRASGDCRCSVCGRTYREHLSCGAFNELCSGEMVKL